MSSTNVVKAAIRIFGVIACVMAARTGYSHHLPLMATATFAIAVIVLPFVWANLYGRVRRYAIQATYPDGRPYIDEIDQALHRTGPSTATAYGDADRDARIAAIEAAGLVAHVYADPFA